MENSSLGRLAGVLAAPTKTFESIRERPTWLVPLLTLIVLAVSVSLAANPKVDWEDVITTQMEKSGREVPAGQIDGIVEFYENWGAAVSIGTTAIGYPIAFLVFAGAFFVAFKIQGSDLSYPASLSTTLYAFTPFALSLLLSLPIVLFANEIGYDQIQSGSFLASNLGAFAPDDTSPMMMALLSSLDVFSIWVVALLAIGFSVVARVSRASSAVVAILFWAVWIGVKVGFAALSGALGG